MAKTTRLEALTAWEEALDELCSEKVPAGYEGAGADRERFLTPIEATLEALSAEIKASRKKSKE